MAERRKKAKSGPVLEGLESPASKPAGAAAMPTVELFTDGSCRGNPGPGGWAFILKHPASGKTKESSGGERETTNNRMELTAAIKGLEALHSPAIVKLWSDSEYVLNGLGEWMFKWQRSGWKKKPNAAEFVKNDDLWRQLFELNQKHLIKLNWVKGHDGHLENERCDQLATAAADQMRGR